MLELTLEEKAIAAAALDHRANFLWDRWERYGKEEDAEAARRHSELATDILTDGKCRAPGYPWTVTR